MDDRGKRADAGDVVSAALTLEISEFDLFRLAYRRWHGADADTASIEKVFVAYLFNQHIPFWVRQYCREALRTDPRDRRRLGIDASVRRRPRPVALGGNSTLVIGVAAMLMFAVIFGFDGGNPATPLSCHGGGPGLRHVETLAYALAGRSEQVSCREPSSR